MTITDADREAAVTYARNFLRWNGYLRDSVRLGQKDSHPLVQAFARHPIPSGRRRGVRGEPQIHFPWAHEANQALSIPPHAMAIVNRALSKVEAHLKGPDQ